MNIRPIIHLTGLLFSSAIFFSCSGESTEDTFAKELVRPAKIATAKSTLYSTKRVYPGVIEASRKSDLAFRVGGPLQELYAVPGKDVKEGELLAKLDRSQFENIYADRNAKFVLAQSQLDKIEELFTKNFVSPSERDQAQANFKAAEAALKAARDDLNYTELRAPFDGKIASVNIDNFQLVNANQKIIQLYGVDSVDIRYSVPEVLIGQVKPVENPREICAKIRFNAHPNHSYTACLKEFESVPDPLTRTYSAVHSMPSITDFQVLPGMAVNVELDLSKYIETTQSTGVMIPLRSVFEEDGASWVWKLDKDMRVHKTKIQIGNIENGYIVALTGLLENDRVVASGVSYLSEGIQVREMTKERGL